ncbi:hypothetical protein FKW31_10195 [Acetobacter sp. DmW_136]|uniref:hypothetical protein n=1 Tax=Acetobacter sp. DmW_136 TaxID=2591091 RepID=UPI001238D037|nr:hypothetical protein [Acetobacter sp. DmW_136]KAA8385172.1 hypothetical protein FKW31_10195 [Acetobacter sp. DmW_136]
MNVYIDAAETMLMLLGIAVVIYGPLQEAWIDTLRQKLFAQRDELFELAASGEITCDNPVYRQIRDQINSRIRYAHRISLPRTILFLKLPSGSTKTNVGIDLLQITNIQLREKLEKIITTSDYLVAASIIERGPVTRLLCIFAIIVMAIFEVVKGGGKSFEWLLTLKAAKIDAKSKIYGPLAASIQREISAAKC